MKATFREVPQTFCCALGNRRSPLRLTGPSAHTGRHREPPGNTFQTLRKSAHDWSRSFAADVEGYTAPTRSAPSMGLSERRAILDRLIGKHRGRIAAPRSNLLLNLLPLRHAGPSSDFRPSSSVANEPIVDNGPRWPSLDGLGCCGRPALTVLRQTTLNMGLSDRQLDVRWLELPPQVIVDFQNVRLISDDAELLQSERVGTPHRGARCLFRNDRCGRTPFSWRSDEQTQAGKSVKGRPQSEKGRAGATEQAGHC